MDLNRNRLYELIGPISTEDIFAAICSKQICEHWYRKCGVRGIESVLGGFQKKLQQSSVFDTSLKTVSGTASQPE